MRYEPKGVGLILGAILLGALGEWLGGGRYEGLFALFVGGGIIALIVWVVVSAFFEPLMVRMGDNESLIEKQNETIPEEFWELLLWAAERGKFCKRDLADAFGLGRKVAGEIGKVMKIFCTDNGQDSTELEFAFSKEQVLKMKRNWQFHCLTSSSMREKLWEVRDFDEWLAPLTLLEKEERDKFAHLKLYFKKESWSWKFWDVALWVAKKGQFSISEVQSSFKMDDFSRASRLVDQMEHLGICGKAKGDSEPRDILMCPEEVATLRKKWQDEGISSEKEESDKFANLKLDKKFWDMALWVAKKGQFSISEVQRSFKMDFSSASRLVDQMEHLGICGKAKGNPKSRDILMCPEEVATLRKKWQDEVF